MNNFEWGTKCDPKEPHERYKKIMQKCTLLDYGYQDPPLEPGLVLVLESAGEHLVTRPGQDQSKMVMWRFLVGYKM